MQIWANGMVRLWMLLLSLLSHSSLRGSRLRSVLLMLLLLFADSVDLYHREFLLGFLFYFYIHFYFRICLNSFMTALALLLAQNNWKHLTCNFSLNWIQLIVRGMYASYELQWYECSRTHTTFKSNRIDILSATHDSWEKGIKYVWFHTHTYSMNNVVYDNRNWEKEIQFIGCFFIYLFLAV